MTLRDWLVAAAMVVLILLVFVPWLVQSRTESRKAMCEHRLRRITIATVLYHFYNQQLPYYRSQSQGAWKDLPAQSWGASILPRLARSEGHFPQDGLPPDARRRIPELVCPDRPFDEADSGPQLSYVINCGQPDENPPLPLPPDGLASGISFDGLPREPERRLHLSLGQIEVMDGTGYTLLASENLDAGSLTDSSEARIGFLWTPSLAANRPAKSLRIEPINSRRGEGDGTPRFARPSSLHGAGVNIAYLSGRLRWIDEKIDEIVWMRMMTSDDSSLTDPATGKPLGEPYRKE